MSIDSFEKKNINYLKKYEKKIIPSVTIKYLKNLDLFIKTSYEIFGAKCSSNINTSWISNQKYQYQKGIYK